MRVYRKRERAADMVTASEIAAFVYCPEQWRLQYGLGLKPGNRAALDTGTRHHERKAVAEQIAGGSITLGRLMDVETGEGWGCGCGCPGRAFHQNQGSQAATRGTVRRLRGFKPGCVELVGSAAMAAEGCSTPARSIPWQAPRR
jgi:hypothetical protein